MNWNPFYKTPIAIENESMSQGMQDPNMLRGAGAQLPARTFPIAGMPGDQTQPMPGSRFTSPTQQPVQMPGQRQYLGGWSPFGMPLGAFSGGMYDQQMNNGFLRRYTPPQLQGSRLQNQGGFMGFRGPQFGPNQNTYFRQNQNIMSQLAQLQQLVPQLQALQAWQQQQEAQRQQSDGGGGGGDGPSGNNDGTADAL